jgi:signal transduction histidine kinase
MRVLSCLLLWLLPAAALPADEAKRVLIFVPESAAVPAIADFTQRFRQTVQREWPGTVTVNIESLDMAWFGSAEYQRALRDFYLVKYREHRPDAIVAFVDATPLTVYLQRALWPQVPVLSIFNDDFFVAMLDQGPYLRANWADFDAGSSEREMGAWAYLSQEIRAAAPGREFIALTGLTLEELKQRVQALPPDSVIILVGFMQDASGRSLISRDVVQMLHAGASPPLFSVHKTMMGSGLTGGVLLDYEQLGQEMARRTLRLLAGESASSLPPGSIEANLPTVDERELKRWRIPEDRLPPGTVVRFHEPGLWERYRWQASAALGATLVQAGLITVLLLERRQRKRAQRLNLAVLDSLPGSVAILDRAGTVHRASPAADRFEEQAGLPSPEVLRPGSPYLEAFHEAALADPTGLEGVVALLREVLEERAHEGAVEFPGFHPGTWFELRARRLELPEGGAVVALVNITARKRAEWEARQARDERAHLERVAAVGELGVSIAHELNQPLTAIQTNAETAQALLQRTPLNLPLLHEVLQDILSDNMRAGEVIRRMRALLKKGEAQIAPHDFNELVREVARLVSNEVHLRGVHLTLQLSEAPLPIQGDGVQLQQVVLNLVVNALDAVSACPPGERHVGLRTQRHEQQVELAVEDTGVGLSPETLQRLFEPFFTTKRTGLGMGLSISRSILEVHQGRLQAEPREGRGARFRCTLPCV